MSAANYHYCFCSLLEGLEELGRDGFITYMRLGDEVRKVRNKTMVEVVLSDGKSGDMLICRYNAYNEGTQGISPRCYVSQDEADNPSHICSWRDRQLMLEQLGHCESMDQREREAAHEKLKSWSIHRVRNAFDVMNVPMGANEKGITQALGTDMMHASDSGFIPYITKCVVDPITARPKEQLDQLVDVMLSRQKSTLRDQFPRTNFSHGFTNLTRLTADEKVGALFTLLILLHTRAGYHILEKVKCSRRNLLQKTLSMI